jgi:hypothetical protein
VAFFGIIGGVVLVALIERLGIIERLGSYLLHPW